MGINSSFSTPLLEMFTPSEPARPFGARSASTSPHTAYFNPARLTLSSTSFEITYIGLKQDTYIHLDAKPQGYDVPESIYQARLSVDGVTQGLPLRPFPSKNLPEPREDTQHNHISHFTLIGFTSRFLKDRLVIGMSAVLPVNVFQAQRPFYVDERAQFFSNRLNFELLGDRFEVTTFALGVAYQLHPRLSVGVGGALTNTLISMPQIYLPDASDQENVETSPQTQVTPLLTPYLGVVYHHDSFELSSSLHFPSQSRLTGQSQLRFWDFDYPEGKTYLEQEFTLVFLDEPLRITLAPQVEFTFHQTLLEVYGELAWTQWSTYTSRQNHRPVDWVNTWSGRLGAALHWKQHTFGAGLMYEPTPVPEQRGNTNYVDSSRVGSQIGWSWSPSKAISSFEVGVGLQFQRLLKRSHYKSAQASIPVIDEFPDQAIDVTTSLPISSAEGLQTNNPGFPSYHHQGWLTSVFLTLGFTAPSKEERDP